MARVIGVQFLFCKHFPDVLSGQATGMESKSCLLFGSSPVCKDSKAKDAVKDNSVTVSKAEVARYCMVWQLGQQKSPFFSPLLVLCRGQLDSRAIVWDIY